MKNSSMLIEALGTFYQQVGRSGIVKGLDEIYTNEIMSRYTEVIRKKISSRDGGLPDLAHFGNIKWEDYNPSTQEIKISSPKGEYIDISTVNYISFPYLSNGVFFKVDNGMVKGNISNELSKINSSTYPIIYHSDHRSNGYMNTLGGYMDELEPLQENNTAHEVSSLLTGMAMYSQDSLYNLNKMANIMCGSVYSSGDGVVLSISETEIDTTTGFYYYDKEKNGECIVSEGDNLSGITLLTKTVDIILDGSLLPEIELIEKRMRAFSSEPTHTDFLKKLSSSIVKKKYTILIPLNIFSSLEKDGVSMLSKIMNVSLSKSFQSVTTNVYNDRASIGSLSAMVIPDEVTVVVSDEFLFRVLQEDSDTVTYEANENLSIVEKESIGTIDNYRFNMDPIIIEEIVDLVDSNNKYIPAESESGFAEEIYLAGKKYVHSIVDVDEEFSPTVKDESGMLSPEKHESFYEGSVILEDDNAFTEDGERSILAMDIADIIMKDKVKVVKELLSDISVSLDLDTSSEVAEHSVLKFNGEDLLKAKSQAFGTSEVSSSHHLASTNKIAPSSKVYSEGLNAMDNSFISSSDSKAILVSVKDITKPLDESSIIGDNEIDSI